MTLNVKKGVLWIFWQFRAARHISRANCAKIEIDMEKQRMKFSALSVDFSGPSLDFLGLGNLHMRASKSGTHI